MLLLKAQETGVEHMHSFISLGEETCFLLLGEHILANRHTHTHKHAHKKIKTTKIRELPSSCDKKDTPSPEVKLEAYSFFLRCRSIVDGTSLRNPCFPAREIFLQFFFPNENNIRSRGKERTRSVFSSKKLH